MAGMQTGRGTLVQTRLGPDISGEISCSPGLRPAAGQYLLGIADSPYPQTLPVPLFAADYTPNGFVFAAGPPAMGAPGASLILRGPLGKGFSLPPSARRVALCALGSTAGRLLSLVQPALRQDAAVLLVCDHIPEFLPAAVELLLYDNPARRSIHLAEAAEWTDYLALDLSRDLLQSPAGLGLPSKPLGATNGQALITTPLPCGGSADCGACAVHQRRGWLLACRDGPVLDLNRLW